MSNVINKKDFSPEQLALYEACHAIPPNMPEIRKLLEAGVSPDIKYNTDEYPSEKNLLQDMIESFSFDVTFYETDDNVSPNTYCKLYS